LRSIAYAHLPQIAIETT